MVMKRVDIHGTHRTDVETKQSTANDRNGGDAVDVTALVNHGGVLSCQSPYKWIYWMDPKAEQAWLKENNHDVGAQKGFICHAPLGVIPGAQLGSGEQRGSPAADLSLSQVTSILVRLSENTLLCFLPWYSLRREIR